MGERLGARAELFHCAGTEILDHDIGARGEPERQRDALRLSQIDAQRALVAVEGREEAERHAGQPARVVAVGRGFDLDDVGAEIGQRHAAARAHHHMAEFEHAHARGGPESLSFIALASRVRKFWECRPRRRGHADFSCGRPALSASRARILGVQINSGVEPLALQQIDEVFGRDIAYRARRERAAAEPAERAVEAAHALFETSQRIGERQAERVVQV